MGCGNVRSHPRTPACPSLHPLTHYKLFARVRVCGCAKFRTSALLHTFFSKIFKLTKPTKLARTSHTYRTFCVRVCGCAKFRTFALLHTFFSKNFKLTQPTKLARTLHTFCTSAYVGNFALLHTFLQFFSKKYQRPYLHAHRTHFSHFECAKCAKFRTFTLLHTFLQFLLTNSTGHSCTHSPIFTLPTNQI